MEAELNIVITITQIKNYNVPTLGKSLRKRHKRDIFLGDISSISEYSMLNGAKTDLIDCGLIILSDGEKIKTKESYEDIRGVWLNYLSYLQTITEQK